MALRVGFCAALPLLAAASQFVCNVTAEAEPALAQGEVVRFCAHLLPQGVKAEFELRVDRFTAVTARRVYDAAGGSATDLAFQLGGSAVVSAPSAYVRPGSAARVFPLFNVLVTLKEGVPVAVEVEDIGAACAATAAAEPPVATDPALPATNSTRNCPVEPCAAAESATGRCDFKALVAWVGTDRHGTALISSAERLASYKRYNLPGLFAGVLAVDNNLSPASPEPYQPELLRPEVAARLTPA